ncbi:MAG: SAM-dependent chlorinase/fluorinase [Thermoplasmata archaeon]|nr:SAM-dependent chlorinase/fluorinase [Thermoplasmata archaeon]
MKGVLSRLLPAGHVVDLLHDLPAHSIAEAAFLLRFIAPTFPPGTVHVAIVDPGVGGRRAPIAIQTTDGSFLVGPDNGVLMPLADHLGAPVTIRLDPKQDVGGPVVGATFDGRDLFAPAAARLALGTPLRELGTPWSPRAGPHLLGVRSSAGGRGHIVHIDRFGNLITDLPSEWLPAPPSTVRLTLQGRPSRVLPLRRTYEDLSPRGLGILGSSFGLAEVAVREGRAVDRLAARVGAAVGLEGVSRGGEAGRKRKYRAK